MSGSETTALVRAFLNGEKQAFNKLVLLYQNRIYNLVFNYLKHPEEAKDTTQDIFVTVHRTIGSLKDITKFKSWLYQVAINHCRNRYKSLKRKGFFSSYSLDDPDSYLQLSSNDSPEKKVEHRDMINIIREEMAKMPEQEKEIIVLRDIQELSYEEISSILDLPLGTVKSRLNRARLALKSRLEQYL